MATFFFDIDGTLAHLGNIVEGNRETLKSLREQGHFVCICSGRPIHYVEDLLGNYCDAIIANNGRYISHKGSCIFENPIDPEKMWEYHQIAQAAGGMCNFTGLHHRYAYTIPPIYRDILDNDQKAKVVGIKQSDIVEAYSFEVNFLPPIEFETMQIAFGEDVVLNNHFNDFSADASTASFHKGNGIHKLIELLHLDKADTYAFGDGSNDLCMFQAVAHTIAMGNAVEPLKQCASFISEDFQKQGIQVALHHYKFL